MAANGEENHQNAESSEQAESKNDDQRYTQQSEFWYNTHEKSILVDSIKNGFHSMSSSIKHFVGADNDNYNENNLKEKDEKEDDEKSEPGDKETFIIKIQRLCCCERTDKKEGTPNKMVEEKKNR